ncbi:PilZ domain-containing protein [Chromohalobacter sp. TMW 2.2308]|uniref:HD domain-containing phosphohydrolase n=1 Tax=Chromohalobacter TaxID=42054 RepID=UPI001FFDA6C0|nr:MULTISPECIES: HD domain-containing phosphohydrolase [Chromohalobacter]MCK2042918.1 PilZ domain-containing protein [Chromohalobacter moromii]MCT8514562.1 PilZ domain-containing protein [Chromohalobacter sp. TMW 2.2271]
MSSPDSAPTQDVTHPGELYGFLEALTLPGGASLCFESGDGTPWPVVVMDIVQEDSLCLDVSAVREIIPRLRRGETFQLMGQVDGAMLTTQTLAVNEWREQGERLQVVCDYPQAVSVMHRRQSFRAALRAGMEVSVLLRVAGEETSYEGRLCNLSLGGCLIALPLAAAAAIKPEKAIESIRLTFPNQRHFELPASVRHVRTDEAWTQAQAGCEFIGLSPAMERLVWYCVKEIERESARTVMHTGRPLEPSTLFQMPDAARRDVSRRQQARSQPGGAMASRLQKVADYLNAQLVQLKSGEPVASTQLSRSTDTLLTLWQQDRQALLYASACLTQESHLVQHSLMVAVRMLDLAQSRRMAPERLKAVVACVLLHDLGKGMLPDALLRDEVLCPEEQDQLHTHVGLIRERLDDCRWLDGDVVEQVIGMANERLDGSGYPAGKRGDALPELARMMAVVDVADVMTRPRPGRAAWTQREVYRHLLTQDEGFDNTWVQRYIRRFGMAPIGSLALYANGALAWVQRHDAHGTPSQVHVVLNTRNPKRRLDQPLSGNDLDQLGGLKEAVNSARYRLTPV